MFYSFPHRRWFFVITMVMGFASAHAEDMPAPITITQADRANIIGSGNDFASDMYGVLKAKRGNFFFSPESITEALAMTFAGARAQTANEMQAALNFHMNNDFTHAALAELLREKNARSAKGGYDFAIANAVWVQKDFELLPAFTDVVTKHYDAQAQSLDFASADATTTINQWVEGKTAHKIKDLIAPGSLDKETRMVLTNAVYFKADWKKAFEKSATQTADFHLNPSQSARVQMMSQHCKECRYSKSENYQLLGIPYKGDDIELVVFLPYDQNGMADFEKGFNPQTLRVALESLEPVPEVNVALPRFHMESEFSLKAPLMALGMKSAFDAAHADFSGMTGKRDLFISDVVHKTYIDVDEAGTEAAAATAVVMMPTAMRLSGPVPEFRADHPFIFALHDMHTNAVYFMGRMENPDTK